MDTTTVDTHTVVLEKIRIALDMFISERFIEGGIDIGRDVADRFRIKMDGYLLGENIKTYLYPRNWWEALKEELFDLPFFPQFLKSPVKYKEIVVQAVYPDFRPSLNGQRYITASYLRDGEWS